MTSKSSSLSQTLQFITTIKLQEVEKQRLAYQKHAEVIHEADTTGDLIGKIEVLARAIKGWTGSGALADYEADIGGGLNLSNLEFWLQQAKKDPSFSRELAEKWAKTLEDHIQHISVRFDAAKLFGNLFNEWLQSEDSSAVDHQSSTDADDEDSDVTMKDAASFVEVGRQELHDQKAQLMSIVFDEHQVDAEKLKEYLEELFKSEESATALNVLRQTLRDHGRYLRRGKLSVPTVNEAIQGLLMTGLMDEAKRTTLKTFSQNPTILEELTSVVNMRLASIDSWKWPKSGLPVEMRRHLNGKYRSFTDPDIIDAVVLHYIGVSWQVCLKHALIRLFDSKAWARPLSLPTPKSSERRCSQLRTQHGASIESERDSSRRKDFFLSQLQSNTTTPIAYGDSVANSQAGAKTAFSIKQKLLHIMTTECYLDKTLHGTHAIVCSDLEWFGPSLPHNAILTILEFLGLPPLWLSFFKTFLAAPLRFSDDEGHIQTRKRGTPINYAMSVVCGEAILFIMDYAVNQRANGLYLHRLHDDLWLWDTDVRKCAAGWAEMNRYAGLVGLKFNQKKTGSAVVGPPAPLSLDFGLPKGDVRWGFLKFELSESRFIIDQEQIDSHIVELRRQLNATKSVFGWINVYNKYMAFILRNCGGIPANCFGQAHLNDLIDTLARIQRQIFPTTVHENGGGAIGYLRKVIEERFAVKDLPEGYFYLPIGVGGLELRNTMLELLALSRGDKPLLTRIATSENQTRGVKRKRGEEVKMAAKRPKGGVSDDDEDEESASWTSASKDQFDEEKIASEDIFIKRMEHDRKDYDTLKEAWELDSARRRSQKFLTPEDDEFMSFEEYTSLRECWLRPWATSYRYMLSSPSLITMIQVPNIRALLDSNPTHKRWRSVGWYEKWVISMYGEEVMQKFGGLEPVDSSLIPVGMVNLFRTSRLKLDQ